MRKSKYALNFECKIKSKHLLENYTYLRGDLYRGSSCYREQQMTISINFRKVLYYITSNEVSLPCFICSM